MKLHTSYPYSLLQHGLPQSYPSLAQNLRTEVAIMGAGITGALVAWYLTEAGVPCVVVDRRHVATGSTAASTSLIQYEIDTPLHELARRIGYAPALKSYQLCLEAIDELERLSAHKELDCCFERKASLQFASFKKHALPLKQEYELRKKAGFNVSYLGASDLVGQYNLHKPAGLFSEDAAQLDAFLFTYKLLQEVNQRGGAVYDHTPIVAIDPAKRGITLHTDEGYRVQARKLVMACGYESQQYIPQRLETLYTTYALVSEPLAREHFWHCNSLIWETARAYLYLRTTPDRRILVGGKDTPYSARTGFDLLPQKTKALRAAFQQLFPYLPIKTDFMWAGVFGSSKDGLPYIGSVPERPHTYFALGYGGNGITFSVLAAQIIRDLIGGRSNPHADLFSFNR